MDIWKILGIEKTKDKNVIRDAYRSRLVLVNPEDDQKGFMELRQAYDDAMHLADAPEDVDKEKSEEDAGSQFEDTPIGRWLAQIDAVYSDINKRKDIDNWEKLLEDDVCFSLDTKTAARDALLRYLMDHNYLPQKVWILLDHKFMLTEYKEELYEKFPVEYIDRGVIDNIQYREFVDLDRLKSKGGTKYDDYLMLCNRAYNCASAGKNDEVRECIDKMDELRIYHPYRDICEVRYYIAAKDYKKAELLMGFLLEQYPKDIQVLRYSGILYAMEKEFDKAVEYYRQILDMEPDYYEVNFELGEVYFAAERYEEARKAYDKTFDLHKTNYIGQKINDCVENLSEKYEKEYKEDPDNADKAIRYAKNQYQLLKTENAMNILKKVNPGESNNNLIEYNHIMGCCYIYDEAYEKAMPYLEKWIQGTENLKEDGTEETTHLRKGLVYSYLYTAYALCGLGKSDEEIEEYLKKALATGINDIDVYEYKARILFRRKKYEDVMAVCDDIFRCDANSVEGHIFRAQALYEMGYIRDAAAEYENAIRIEPYDLKIYMEKIKCYMRIDEYDEAEKVLKYLKENDVKYEEIDMQEAVIAAERGERKEALKVIQRLIEDEEKKILEKMSESSTEHDADISKLRKNKFLSRLYYEAAIIYYKEQEEKKAFDYINRALEYNPVSEDALYTKAMLLKHRREYKEAMECLNKLSEEKPYHLSVNARLGEIYGVLKEYEKEVEYYTRQLKIMPDARIYYDRGYAYANMNQFEEAIRDYKKCIDLDADSEMAVFAYTAMGDVYVYDEQEEKGIEYYQTALEKTYPEPKLYIYHLLATAYTRIGDEEKALENAREYRDRAKEPNNNFARVFEMCGNYQEALDGYRLYIESLKRKNIQYAKYKEIHKICKCYILMGRIEEASKIIEEIYTGPEEGRQNADMWKLELYHIFIRLYKSNHKSNGHGGIFGSYFKKDFTKTDLRILIDHYLTKNLNSEDGWDVVLLRFLFELRDKEYDKIKYNQPNMQAIVKKLEDEIVSFESRKTINNRPYILVRKAAVCMEKGDFAAAMKLLEQAMVIKKCQYCDSKQCSEAVFTKAVLLELMGNLQEASKYYEKAKELCKADAMYKIEYERIRMKNNN